MVEELAAAAISAIAVAAPVVKNVGDLIEGAQRIRQFAFDIFDRFRKKVPEQPEAALSVACAEVAAMPTPEWEKKVEQVAEVQLAQLPPEERQAITETVKLMQPRIRANFARREDPLGTTRPAHWAISRPEDLMPFLPPRPPMFRRGDKVPDSPRWTLVERLGIGGFGEVWKAVNCEDDCSVFKFCLDPESQQRMFSHERKIIRTVKSELDDHPHIVKLMDSHLEGSTPWLQYEYAPGGDLMRHFAAWPADLAARVAMAVEKTIVLADTLAHCHRMDPCVIHRDMKPANVVIGKRGEYKITDFGIGDTTARQALEEARIVTAGGMTVTTTSVRCFNTPMYASPDQRKGLAPHPSDDVHALGVMLYQMILGDLNLELGHDMWNDLEELMLCNDLLRVLDHAVATRVDRRYPDAGAFADALRSLPKKLIVEPVAVHVPTAEELHAKFRAEIDQYQQQARRLVDDARRLADQREWQQAKLLLDQIVHPVLRPTEFYKYVSLYADGKRLKNALGMEFAWVPPGESWLGGGGGNPGTTRFVVETGFWAGVYPVTQAEWKAVVGDNPSHFGGQPRHPVEKVSWDRVTKEFLPKLNEKCRSDGYLYRLPTADEWEYLCRGGPISQEESAFHYYFAKSRTDLASCPTNELAPDMANFGHGSSGRTSEVGLYHPNPLGIYDLVGNVWEWTSTPDGSGRVSRGGGWYLSAEYCAAACRGAGSPGGAGNCLGFRLLAVPLDAQ